LGKAGVAHHYASTLLCQTRLAPYSSWSTLTSDLRMARTLLSLDRQLQLAGDQAWPLLASAAEQPEHHREALAHPAQAAQSYARPLP
jgi:hypothetical protein